jgi:hypothetical protein
VKSTTNTNAHTEQKEKSQEIRLPVSLRDYFAGLAMQGMLSNSAFDTIEGMMHVSVVAYMMADAMMKAREMK